jgi:hypothetical protein
MTHALYILGKEGYTRARRRIHQHEHSRVRTHTQEYVIQLALPREQWFANALQCYITRTLPVLIIT